MLLVMHCMDNPFPSALIDTNISFVLRDSVTGTVWHCHCSNAAD